MSPGFGRSRSRCPPPIRFGIFLRAIGQTAPIGVTASLACAEPPVVVPIAVPSDAQSLVVLAGERTLAHPTRDGTLVPLLLPAGSTVAHAAFFVETLEQLDLEEGPIERPPTADEGPGPLVRRLPAPMTTLVAELPGPFRPGPSSRFSNVSIPPRRTCPSWQIETGTTLTDLARPTGVFLLGGGRMLVTGLKSSYVFPPRGPPERWTAAPPVADGFVDGAGWVWLASRDGAIHRLSPDLAASDEPGQPVAEAGAVVRGLDGPRDRAAEEVVAALADGRIVRLGAGGELELGVVDLGAHGGFEDLAYLDGGALLGFARKLEAVRVSGDAVFDEPVLPGWQGPIENGLRALEPTSDGWILAGTKLGQLLYRNQRGRWFSASNPDTSVVGFRRVVPFEGGAAWVDDQAVVFVHGPEGRICDPVTPFGRRDLEGHRIGAAGSSLFVASIGPEGTVAGWLPIRP